MREMREKKKRKEEKNTARYLCVGEKSNVYIYIHLYIYIYVCVCVCVMPYTSGFGSGGFTWQYAASNLKFIPSRGSPCSSSW
jgi:hypothetical protein